MCMGHSLYWLDLPCTCSLVVTGMSALDEPGSRFGQTKVSLQSPSVASRVGRARWTPATSRPECGPCLVAFQSCRGQARLSSRTRKGPSLLCFCACRTAGELCKYMITFTGLSHECVWL